MNGVNVVQFPNLNLEFTLHKTAFEVFGFSIQWYALLITTGFLLALIYAVRNAKKFGVPFNDMLDPVIWGTVFAIIGARTYYVAFHFESYRDDLWQVFNIRGGGMAIYGGVIGAVLAGFVVTRIKKMPILPLLDLCAVGFLIGQGFGRWGNFVNVEAYGAQTAPDYLLGMTSASITSEMGGAVGEQILVHPCFFYESVWCLLGALLLMLYQKHRRFDGEMGLMYLGWYGLERMIVEGLRTDSLYIPGTQIRVSQLLSALLVVTAVVLFVVCSVRYAKQKKQNPDYNPLYAASKASADRLAADAAQTKKEKESFGRFWKKQEDKQPTQPCQKEEENADENPVDPAQ